MSNQELDPQDLARCRAGDPRGLAAVVAAFGDRVFRVCRGVLGQDADAEDAAQEVLLRVFDKAGGFDGRSRFSTWVHRLTVNHALNHRRRARREPVGAPPELEAPDRGPADAAIHREEREELDRRLAALPPSARAILVLREVEGLSYREISSALDVPVGTVMSRLARARARLIEVRAPRRSLSETER